MRLRWPFSQAIDQISDWLISNKQTKWFHSSGPHRTWLTKINGKLWWCRFFHENQIRKWTTCKWQPKKRAILNSPVRSAWDYVWRAVEMPVWGGTNGSFRSGTFIDRHHSIKILIENYSNAFNQKWLPFKGNERFGFEWAKKSCLRHLDISRAQIKPCNSVKIYKNRCDFVKER